MFKPYDCCSFYDEMLDGKNPKKHYVPFYEQLLKFSNEELLTKHMSAQSSFLKQGITFTVYGGDGDTERTMPFDFVPIIIPDDVWQTIEKGMKQRVEALNLFLHDVYHKQLILEAGVIPRKLIENNPYYSREVIGMNIPLHNHIFLAGIDLIRDENGEYRVLEDNLRNPSGISYVYQNRYVMRKMYPEFFRDYAIETLEKQLLQMQKALLSHRPKNLQPDKEPHAVLLTAGIYNSAYYDHVFLAKEMNISLVEGKDLIVKNNIVYLKTIRG
ncbi:MAG TPA: circularly permuted type 2 ATP-grasp protein, partial [Ureibacillus sp.]|nr:circularly permuted type 2 ATP-grasp protein [Ureibacillus sp.]